MAKFHGKTIRFWLPLVPHAYPILVTKENLVTKQNNKKTGLLSIILIENWWGFDIPA